MIIKLGMQYPPYYKPVMVEYSCNKSNISQIETFWLAVDDNNKLIWTKEDNTTIIFDKDIIVRDWWNILEDDDI
jgi:hypothetical protein